MLFPRKSKTPKKGEVSAEEMKKHTESGHEDKVKHTHQAFPIDNKITFKEGKVADYEATENAYRKLRDARSEARLVGVREKRAKAKEDEAAAAKK